MSNQQAANNSGDDNDMFAMFTQNEDYGAPGPSTSAGRSTNAGPSTSASPSANASPSTNAEIYETGTSTKVKYTPEDREYMVQLFREDVRGESTWKQLTDKFNARFAGTVAYFMKASQTRPVRTVEAFACQARTHSATKAECVAWQKRRSDRESAERAQRLKGSNYRNASHDS